MDDSRDDRDSTVQGGTVETVFVFEEEGSTQESPGESFTQHVFDAGGRWTWIVNQDTIDSLRDELC